TRRAVAYCRVSSAAQKPDLKRAAGARNLLCRPRTCQCRVRRGSRRRMNLKRKAFTALMDAVGRGEIARLVVAHKDRLVRFGFPWLEHFCAERGTEILVPSAETLSPEAEIVQDLMTIVHCFSSRLDGLRNYNNYKKSLREALR